MCSLPLAPSTLPNTSRCSDGNRLIRPLLPLGRNPQLYTRLIPVTLSGDHTLERPNQICGSQACLLCWRKVLTIDHWTDVKRTARASGASGVIGNLRCHFYSCFAGRHHQTAAHDPVGRDANTLSRTFAAGNVEDGRQDSVQPARHSRWAGARAHRTSKSGRESCDSPLWPRFAWRPRWFPGRRPLCFRRFH